ADPHEVMVYFYEDGDSRAYLPLLIQDRPLKFMLGEMGLASLPLKRLTVHRGPIVQAPDEKVPELMRQLLDVLCSDLLGSSTALNIETLPVASPLRASADKSRAANRIEPLYLSSYAHQYLQMPENFTAYLAQMNPHARRDIQRRERKLRNH